MKPIDEIEGILNSMPPEDRENAMMRIVALLAERALGSGHEKLPITSSSGALLGYIVAPSATSEEIQTAWDELRDVRLSAVRPVGRLRRLMQADDVKGVEKFTR